MEVELQVFLNAAWSWKHVCIQRGKLKLSAESLHLICTWEKNSNDEAVVTAQLGLWI